MGHPGERRAAMAAEQCPELVVDDRAVGEDEPGAAQQVAVDHRQAVAVRHRQSRCGPVGLRGCRDTPRSRVAFAIRLHRDSRTSFGDPVLPDVDSSRARSRCNRWAVPWRCSTDPGAADDDVGVVGAQHRGVVASRRAAAARRGRRRARRGSRPAWRCRCVSRAARACESVRVRRRRSRPGRRGRGRSARWFRSVTATRSLAVVRDARRAGSLQGDSAAEHVDAHLGVDRRRVDAVLAHDDRRDVRRRDRR